MDGTRRHEYQPILAAVDKGTGRLNAALAGHALRLSNHFCLLSLTTRFPCISEGFPKASAQETSPQETRDIGGRSAAATYLRASLTDRT
ncbi:hypothetical protein GFL84_01820 [Rhizobium leguminosarum bv. viciae]|nr:hypothetical protein [Rhizobium leguminosarum bv. viciae]